MSPLASPGRQAGFEVGDQVWVHGLGKWRRGEVLKIGRTRYLVRYSSRADGTGWRATYFAKTNVLPANLAGPVKPRCPKCGRLVVGGRPGETAEQVLAAHDLAVHAGPPCGPEVTR